MLPTDETPPEDAAAPLSEPGGHGSPADLDYELIRLIGQGGYGEVWLVRDKEGEHRACKVVYRESFQNERPYEREYEGICKFEPVSRANENQVKILHVGRRDASGYFYYIMELADDVRSGTAIAPATYVPRTLRSELEHRGRLPAGECIQIGLWLSAALENLHQHGLIHRDIKPANIIFVKDVPKLADIGLVTEADVTVSYVGTGGFIPPEGPGSAQADVYGLGKVLYEISTGKDRLDYPELPENFGGLPDRATLLEFNSVVAKACEADAGKRYASASELHADLMLLQGGKSIRRMRSSKKKRKLFALTAAALGLLLLVMTASQYFQRQQGRTIEIPPPQAALPEAVRLAQSEAKIRETYRLQLAGGTSAAKQQAAFELVERGSMAEDPATQLASLRVAALLATEAGNFSMAMQTCDKMAERFHISSIPAKADLLTQAGGNVQSAAKRTELAGCCIQTGFEAMAADDYDNGMKLAALAKDCARNSADVHLLKAAEFLGSEMTRCRDGFEGVKRFKEILRNNPGDAEASLAMGKYLCFVKNDWDAGLPLMAHATNETLKAALAAEINEKPKTPDEQIARAKLWRNLADSADGDDKIHYQQRARYWCLKAIATAGKPDKARLQQQLNEWMQAAPTEPGEIHIVSRFDGTETIDIYSDEIRWKSGRGAMNNKINQLILGDLKAGDLKIVKNNGATRFLPDALDFSTARLLNVHKSKKQEKAKLDIEADHVRVTLAHQRPGYAAMDVTVVFGSQP